MRQRAFGWVCVLSFGLLNGHLNLSQHPRTCQTNAGKLPSEGAKSLDQPDCGEKKRCWPKHEDLTRSARVDSPQSCESWTWKNHGKCISLSATDATPLHRAYHRVQAYASIAWKERWTGSLRNVKLHKEMLGYRKTICTITLYPVFANEICR